MFRKKKKKTVLEVLRQHNDIKLSNDVLCDIFRDYKDYICEKARIETIYNYGHLCELFFSYEFSEYCRYIIQEGRMIVDANHPTNSINIPACYRMDPATEALIILRRNHGYGLVANVFKYVPRSFEDTVRINNLEYLRFNFMDYDVYKVEQFKDIRVSDFEELKATDIVIAFSKKQLPYEHDGKTHYFPVILKYN